MPNSQIILSYAKQPKILAGHPWVYPKAIEEIKGTPVAGDWVEIYDNKLQRIGAGFYNPNSLYRVRIMADIPLLKQSIKWPDIVKYRLEKALLLRQTMGLPNENNTAYRLFNSESDGLSGLVIDVLNQILVISSNAYWTELYREQIIEILKQLLPKHKTIWIGQTKTLKKDGWENPFQDDTTGLKTQVKEAGVIFEINFEHIQKTGIFIDQRENHQRLAQLAKGKKVLDLYTYHGGFALHAAKAGAEQVTAVDSSKNAILHAKHNAKLNGITNIEWIEGDAKDYLNTVGNFDIVILDPPKLVPSKRNIEAAKNLYRFLHRETFKHMKSGSILMTCNCSSALSTHEFTKLVSQQALAEQKSIQILGVYGPSICHPILPIFPEGQYLTALLIAIK
jgi:23S rRNA (cytosine1962-C5)-methyltransferase